MQGHIQESITCTNFGNGACVKSKMDKSNGLNSNDIEKIKNECNRKNKILVSNDIRTKSTCQPGIYAVLFDLDGVLIDSGKDIMNAVNWALEQDGLASLSYETIKAHIGNGAKELIENCYKEFGEDKLQLAVSALPKYKKYYLDHSVIETYLYDGVIEGLEKIKSLKMAIVTNKTGVLADQILTILGIRSYFGCIISPESVSKLKPNPEGLLLAMKMMQVNAEETVMVGDSWSDIEAGKSAGVRTIGAFWGLGNRKELENASPTWNAETFSGAIHQLIV